MAAMPMDPSLPTDLVSMPTGMTGAPMLMPNVLGQATSNHNGFGAHAQVVYISVDLNDLF